MWGKGTPGEQCGAANFSSSMAVSTLLWGLGQVTVHCGSGGLMGFLGSGKSEGQLFPDHGQCGVSSLLQAPSM